MKASGNTVRLNKDLMREMLHLNKRSPKNEDITHRSVRALAKTLLLSVNVVIDDTNLNPGVMQGWKDLAKECGVPCEVVDMTDVPIETCVERDNVRKFMRQRYVGYTVVKNMALRSGLKTFNPGEVVLCDIDGTIANIDHRLHFVKGEKKDWGTFFRNMIFDTAIQDVRQMLVGHQTDGKTIIFMSGRPDSYVRETTDWLASYSLPHYTVIMRSASDHRPDEVVKPEMLKKHFPDLSVIHCVYDDRPRVLRVWQELGLNVVDVGHGVEF
jgi:predicted kinase